MIIIDGSQGEGGGQIFRTALTLAMCLGKSVRIENIRARRRRSGLLRQHLTCLRAAKEICSACVEGDEIGSSTVTFKPEAVRSGQYHFAIGSAGSTSLVFQTVLMPLLLTQGETELRLEGGTHNGMAPSFDFIQHCFIPVLAKMGCRVEAKLEQYGFYPAGGGVWRVRIYPAKYIHPLVLDKASKILDIQAFATSARIPTHVTERELKQIAKQCELPKEHLHQRLVNSQGPGNIVSLRVTTAEITELFESVGERDVSAERVANRAIKEMRRYLNATVPVAEHLADQLILPMALGKGGQFRTLKPSQHLLTNIDVVRKMTGVKIAVTENGKDDWTVFVGQHADKIDL